MPFFNKDKFAPNNVPSYSNTSNTKKNKIKQINK